MNKRGQVFLIAAIIFSFLIYSVAIEYNTIKTYPGLEDYKELSDNYQAEYPKVFNYAVYTDQDVNTEVNKFTTDFLANAKTKDANFGVFYIYKDDSGKINIVNTLNKRALIIEYRGTTGGIQKLTLAGNGPVQGNICVNGVGCNTADTSLENFGGTYVEGNIDNVADITELEITILSGTRSSPFYFDITNLTSMSYTLSEASTELTDIDGRPVLNVGVSIVQY